MRFVGFEEVLFNSKQFKGQRQAFKGPASSPCFSSHVPGSTRSDHGGLKTEGHLSREAWWWGTLVTLFEIEKESPSSYRLRKVTHVLPLWEVMESWWK